MSMEIVLSSRNKKKIAEMQAILTAHLPDIRILSLDDIGYVGDIEEDGDTFEANALIKARTAAEACAHRYAGLADDSGLAVDALGGAPGVRSARYAGGHGDDAANNALLIQNLADIPPAERTARFVCALALVLPDGREMTVRGETEGLIIDAPRGNGGFGYDPYFYYPPFAKTFSEMSADEKNAISHRGKAVEKLAEVMENVQCTFNLLCIKESPMNQERIYPPAPTFTSAQRAHLRSLASTMSPVTQIGKGGITENLITTVSDALEARELIKLSVLETSEYTAREAAEALAEATNAAVVGVIGRKLVLYRRSLNGKHHIEL